MQIGLLLLSVSETQYRTNAFGTTNNEMLIYVATIADCKIIILVIYLVVSYSKTYLFKGFMKIYPLLGAGNYKLSCRREIARRHVSFENFRNSVCDDLNLNLKHQ